ncbi:BTB/POZ domain-containing protein 6-like [Stylophora pistillata]|nr:BTB/POZ domain-containing protein 6-like [Stylophora pistillata]
MSLTEENWQTTRPTIKERAKFVFNNDRFSDVKFVVRKMDGESEKKQVIPAHKLVLSISSPVFEAMFYGELPETRDSIELPDCDYESLLELFRYMYSDEVCLNGSNVMRVLYLAKKYMMPSLAERCSEYLQENLDPSNVFSILPAAQKYQEKDLTQRCWKVIAEKTREALKTDDFATLQRSLLNEVIIRDKLTIEEIDLFKAVDLWATEECVRQGLEANGDTKRTILGEEIVKAIRFPTMKVEDFSSAVLDSDILTKQEIISIIKYLNSITKSVEGFSTVKRFGEIKRSCRLGLKSDNPWSYPTRRDCINVSVDRDVSLHAISFFGKENHTYPVTLELIDNTSNLVMTSKTASFPTELLQCEKCSYYGFEVYFDKQITIKKNTSYAISALISGPPSCQGIGCVGSIQCAGVTFTFTNNESSTNGTSAMCGQFPEFLFSLI